MDKRRPHWRTRIVTAFLALALAALSARIVYLQVVDGEAYAELARDERMCREVLPASRGKIYDRHGEVLVANRLVRNLVADRNHLTNVHVRRHAVATAEGIRLGQVAERFDDADVGRRFLAIAIDVLRKHIPAREARTLHGLVGEGSRKVRAVVSRGLPYDRAEALRRDLEKHGVRGFTFEDDNERLYLNPGRLAQVIGFTNAAGEGVGGLERELQEHLAGCAGYRVVERTRRSSELISEHAEERLPRHGSDVVLTIDMGLQCIVERQLEEAVLRHSPEKVMAVFLDPSTGEVLAMASRPHFDQRSREGVRRIHPVADRYEPGSVFKTITLAAGFDQGAVELDTMFFCHNGYFEEGPVRIRDHSPYAFLDTRGILAKSSNIGAFAIARQVGDEAMCRYIKAFGFGARTGIALTGEVGGQVARPGSSWWSKTSLSRLAMGYEVDATALQVANAVAAIANGGNLMKPQIIRSVTSSEGELLYRFTPRKIRRAVSEEAANKVRKAMMAVVAEGGTGKRAAVEGFAVAGKTGTAWKPKEDRSKGYHLNRYVVSFAGFLPAEDPRLVGVIVVDDPKRRAGESIYGGAVAAPIFGAIAEEAMRHLGVAPTVIKRRAARSVPATVAVDAPLYTD